ncbi:hypothetical protein ACHWQZ_G001909 [Mnemiopsis leidyi]
MSLETLTNLKKSKALLDEEIKGLRGTISQRNAELAESHQQRRNLEEQLNQIALRNNGLEQVNLFNNHTMDQLDQDQLQWDQDHHKDESGPSGDGDTSVSDNQRTRTKTQQHAISSEM